MECFRKRHERAALREHAEHHYGEDHMSLTDWLKVIGGSLVALPIIYAFMVVILAMQP
jgi:hypothetical protein